MIASLRDDCLEVFSAAEVAFGHFQVDLCHTATEYALAEHSESANAHRFIFSLRDRDTLVRDLPCTSQR